MEARDDELDRVYRCLSDSTRRKILRRLEETPELRIDALYGELADEMNQSTERVRTRLHHLDLPQLEEADLVVYDDETNTIERGGAFNTGQKLLLS